MFLHKQASIPAFRALLIQCSSLLLLAAFSALLISVSGYRLPLPVQVLLQGLVAMQLAQSLRMASWWRWIHLAFPLAVYGMLQVHLSSSLYLAGFIICAALYWSTYHTQVPFYPSRRQVWQLMLQALPADRPLRLLDIGSGLGDLVMHVAQVRPHWQATGIEIAPLPWLASRLRAGYRRSTANFLYGDYRQLDFAAYDVIFAYLSPAAMQSLWQQARAQIRPGSYLLSYEFEIAGQPPQQVLSLPDGKTELFVWRF